MVLVKCWRSLHWDLVSDDCSAILNVNYTVNGSPFLQRDMHQVHSKRNHIHCIHFWYANSMATVSQRYYLFYQTVTHFTILIKATVYKIVQRRRFTKVLFYQRDHFTILIEATVNKIATFYKIVQF